MVSCQVLKSGRGFLHWVNSDGEGLDQGLLGAWSSAWEVIDDGVRLVYAFDYNT
jgi:hypothetical protein